jgi:hypothetical protein
MKSFILSETADTGRFGESIGRFEDSVLGQVGLDGLGLF